VTTHAKENRQQLRIGEGISSLCKKSFSRTFGFRPLGDALPGCLSPHLATSLNKNMTR
jgi:hypothetical protein